MSRYAPTELLDRAEFTSIAVRSRLLGCDSIQKLKRKFVFGKIFAVVLGTFHEGRASGVDGLECIRVPRGHDREHLGNQAKCDPAGVNGFCHSVSNSAVSERSTIASAKSLSMARAARRRVGSRTPLIVSATAVLLLAAIAIRV